MEPFIGQIIMFGGNFAPRDWAFCHGQLLPISPNTALFSLLGTTYGGDGRTTFGLPDLRGRVAMGYGTGPGLSTIPLGHQGGSAEVTLNSAQIPSHNHSIVSTGGQNGSTTADLKVSDSKGDTSDPASAKSIAGKASPIFKTLSTTDATTVLKDCITGIPSGGGIPSSTEVTGNSQAHSNIQPYLGVNYIIALQGVFPSRS